MRFTRPGDPDPLHLSYCTNVHAGESREEIVGQLRDFAGPVREALGWPRLGIGMWLPHRAATGLIEGDGPEGDGLEGDGLAGVRAVLDEQRLEVVTLNGFPYGSFHDPVVKHRVYHPDWTDPARAAYTLALARILAGLLPDDVGEGSISTLPLAWREPWDDDRAAACRAQLERVVAGLARLEEDTGRRIRLALEPEPGCRVETVREAVEVVADLDRPHVGVCLDLCHLAVQFEDAPSAVALLRRRGVGVPKVQVASALRVPDPGAPGSREALARFAEPRFLHQVRAADGGGCDDLPQALDGAVGDDREWRVHFHAPVHAAAVPPLATTQPSLADDLAHLVGDGDPVTRHLEVETYTWTVLPPRQRPADDASLVAALASELTWVADRLRASGWQEVTP